MNPKYKVGVQRSHCATSNMSAGKNQIPAYLEFTLGNQPVNSKRI